MDTKYDKIGGGYNTTRQADPHLTDRLYALLQAQSGKAYLDLGCGTGNYTIALAGKGLTFTGVEPSEKMLAEAMSRNQDITWLKGTAEQIPVANESVDGIIATLTIHHWDDIQSAFAEISRVLRPQGRLVLFTSTPEQMSGYWLNHYFPEMLWASMLEMPPLYEIQDAITQAGLELSNIEKYFIHSDLRDCFLYVGKNKPERYFDEQIRQGISSFASLSHTKEVALGLSNLRNDIDCGAFASIYEEHENDLGDYLFITVEKRW